jgi:hypothetical protein
MLYLISLPTANTDPMIPQKERIKTVIVADGGGVVLRGAASVKTTIRCALLHCKKVIDLPDPSCDVTNQTLPSGE